MSPVQIDISPNQNGGILKKIIKKGVLESPSLGCEVEVSIKNVSHSPDTEGEVSKLVLGEGIKMKLHLRKNQLLLFFLLALCTLSY